MTPKTPSAWAVRIASMTPADWAPAYAVVNKVLAERGSAGRWQPPDAGKPPADAGMTFVLSLLDEGLVRTLISPPTEAELETALWEMNGFHANVPPVAGEIFRRWELAERRHNPALIAAVGLIRSRKAGVAPAGDMGEVRAAMAGVLRAFDTLDAAVTKAEGK